MKTKSFEELTEALLKFFGMEPNSSVGQYLTGALAIPFKIFSAEGDTYTVYATALALVYLDSALTDMPTPAMENPSLNLGQFFEDLDTYKELVPQDFVSEGFWDSFKYFGFLPVPIKIRVWRAVCWMCVYLHRNTDEVWLTQQAAFNMFERAILILQNHKLA